MIKITEDLEKITGIKPSTFEKIFSSIEYVILDNVSEFSLDNTGTIEFDIGFGVLSLNISEDEIKYDFKPSKKFENKLVKSVNEHENQLEIVLFNNINKNIYKTYKDML